MTISSLIAKGGRTSGRKRGSSEEGTSRKWHSWEVLDSNNWVVREKDADGKPVVKDLVADFMSKIRLRS